MLRFALLALVACSARTSPLVDAASGDDAPIDGAIDGPPPSNVKPQLVTSFAGESGAQGTHNCGRSGGATCAYRDHPDAVVASNGTYVVEATGQSVTVFDASTGAQLAQTSATAFVTAAGGTTPGAINDPYVDWNEFAQRWIVSIPTDKQDFVIVSAGSDPRGAWSGSALTATNHGDVTIKLAHDRNGEYLGEFPFDGGGVADANTASFSWYCFAIPTVEMMWAGSFAPAHTNKRNCAYEARPVMDHDPQKPANAPFFYVGRTCPAGSCQNSTNFAMGLIVHRGTWNGTSIALDSIGEGGGDRIVPSGFLYNTPIMASQGGPAVATTESHRVFAAEQRVSTIHAVVGSGPCAANCGAQGSDAHQLLFYVAIDISGYPAVTLADSAKISDPALDLAYPGLAIDGAGNIGLTAMCTSASQRMSLCAWAHGAGDPAGKIAGPVVLFPGTQAYSCNGGAQVGTGTYANAVVDGADPSSLWMVEQDGESATSCQWTTRIAKLAIR